MKKISFAIVIFALISSACEKEAQTEGQQADVVPAKTVEKGKTPAKQVDADAATTKGNMAFSVNGEKKSFGHLPAKQNFAMSVGTMLRSSPGAGAKEELSINAMNFNAKEAKLPQTISLDLAKMMKDDKSPVAAATSPKAIVNFVSKDGVEYRAYTDVTFESYSGGVLKGKIEDTELPTIKPKDRGKPPVKLTEARFEVTL